MASSATMVPPGSFTTDPMSPLYVNGMPLGPLVEALGRNQEILNSQKQTAASQFWSTPRRWCTDQTQEVFEVNLNAAKKINFIAFDLARFPHKAYLFYLDPKTKAWKPVLNTAKRPVVSNVVNSLPSVIVPAPPGSNSHPQHYGAGHWTHREFKVSPVTAASFRLVLVRQRTDHLPTNTQGKNVTYSLGVRGFDLGYKVKGVDDLPRTTRNPVIVTEKDSFTTTTDLLGSQVSLSVRENRASDLLNGALWRSEPQPIPNAVVNLYVDARDGQGEAQVVDRFTLDPLTTGVHMNLYYSSDSIDPDHFAASDNPLAFPITRGIGGVNAAAAGLEFPAAVGYVDIDNAAVQFDNTKPFWLGLVVQPQFTAEDTTRHVFFDNGALRVEWTGSAIAATLGAATLLRDDIPFSTNQKLLLAIAYDGTYLTLYAAGSGQEVLVADNRRGTAPATSTGMRSPIRLGGLLVGDDEDPGQGNFRLLSLILKTEVPPGEDVYETYFADSADYVVESEFVQDDTGSADNALLRYDPSFQTPGTDSLNPLGLLGGPGNRFEDLVWTPISRDYKLHKGTCIFDPVRARFFKFEFTNLLPQPYDDYEPITRKVQVFPTSMYYPTLTVSASKNSAGGGATVSKQAAAVPHYADQVRLYTNVPNTTPAGTYTPTEALYSTDPLAALRLRQQSLYYSLQQWHLNTTSPRFVDVTKHVYEHVQITHTQRLAYFVGLNSISMSRLDYSVSDDTEQYLELFHDEANFALDPNGQPLNTWTLGEGFLSAPQSTELSTVTAQSKVFPSRRKVTAIQFATQQTPPVQLLPDPDFDDSSLAHWIAYGDTQVAPSDDFTTDIGTMARVARDSTANFWGTVERRYASWDAIEASDPDPNKPLWSDIEVADNSLPYGGIQSAAQVAVSDAGRLYAAARVYATDTLSAPLYVQIVGEDGQVISSESINVVAGQVAEWFTSYTVGEGGAVSALSWQQIEDGGLTPDNDPTHPTWAEMEAKGSWDQVDLSVANLLGKVYARIVQDQPTTDVWYVDNLSLYDDAIVWEFSNDSGQTWYPVYDIRNDPQGVFVFPGSTDDQAGLGLCWRVNANRGNQQISSLAIRPWYDSLTSSVPHRETIQSSGPNQALIDHYPPITDDPRWKVWHKPIPEEWWFAFRQWVLQQAAPTETGLSQIVAPDTIVPVDEGGLAIPEPTLPSGVLPVNAIGSVIVLPLLPVADDNLFLSATTIVAP